MRGELQHFQPGPGTICTFVIYIAGLVAHVRFFRVLEDSLVELDRDGRLLPSQVPGKKQRKIPTAPASTGDAQDGSETLEPAVSPAGPLILLHPANIPELTRVPEV